MEKRKFILPADLAAEFKKKSSSDLELEGNGGKGSAKKIEFDWIMVDKSTPDHKDVPKNERVVDGKGPFKPRPINEDPEPRSTILMLPLAPPNAGSSFKLSFGNADGGDEIEFTLIEADFAAKRGEFIDDEIVIEEAGAFFTILNPDSGQFETFVNNNTDNEVVVAKYFKEDTFDMLKCSFLVNLAG